MPAPGVLQIAQARRWQASGGGTGRRVAARLPGFSGQLARIIATRALDANGSDVVHDLWRSNRAGDQPATTSTQTARPCCMRVHVLLECARELAKTEFVALGLDRALRKDRAL